jgi:hypothetical protein
MDDIAGSPIFNIKNKSPQVFVDLLRDLADTVEKAGTQSKVLVAALDDTSKCINFYLFSCATGEIKTTSFDIPDLSGASSQVLIETIAKTTIDRIAKQENALVAWKITNFLCNILNN